ncbi:hypothetical protein B8W69_03585 [Mycobacterium vulneris]|uniref:Uncharacterized protein n=1 Tax=Mycolicibacterium vulneris TaxID=547163 RepID=A0A1X2LC34_9MYCO|nr:hypothetical protein B8W69_03585 [Mycolicibacterium vulneris]
MDEDDFLGRWMAEYLAEVLAKSERLSGQARDSARREAFDVVLQLWQRRRELPMAGTPLGNFDNIFAALDRLAGDTRWGYFDLFRNSRAPAPDSLMVSDLLEAACALDAGARKVVRLAVAVAGAQASDEEEEWTSVARDVLEDDYRRAIRRLERLRSDPRKDLDGTSDTADDKSLSVEPVSVATERLIEAIDSLSESLRAVKQWLNHRDT